MRVLVLQHTRTNPAGVYADLVRARGGSTHVVELDEGEPLPAWEGFDAMIAMGGAMGVNDVDRYAWLESEMRVIHDAVHAGLPFWGACLGSQLLAGSLSARIERMKQPEIGFATIIPTAAAASDPVFSELSRPFEAFQWHHDAFTLPAGAVHLASSPACANQAFRWGDNAYAVQFHLEATVVMVKEWFQGRGNRASVERQLGPGAPDRILDELQRREGEQRANAAILAGRWLDRIGRRHGSRPAPHP